MRGQESIEWESSNVLLCNMLTRSTIAVNFSGFNATNFVKLKETHV